MSFYDEIRKAQNLKQELIEYERKPLSERYERLIMRIANAISGEVRSNLISKAKDVPPNIPFSYEGFVYCFAWTGYNDCSFSIYELFDIQREYYSNPEKLSVCMNPLGQEVFNMCYQILSKDGIIIKSFCCKGEYDDCVDLPLQVEFVRKTPSKLKNQKAIWKLKGSNKKVTIEKGSMGTFTSRDYHLDDYFNLGIHCCYHADSFR